MSVIEELPDTEAPDAWRGRLVAVRAGLFRASVVVLSLSVVGVVVWLMTLSAAQRTTAAQAASAEVPVAAAEPVEATPTRDPAETGTDEVAATTALQVSRSWAEKVSARTGIPVRAVLAYANAQLLIDQQQPGCGLSWNTLAAIGAVESGHASHDGTALLPSGRTDRPIRGPVLDGNGVGAVRDTDDGRLDGNSRWDRALGPMQFIPSTWKRWAADGNGDGVADPDQLDDAAFTAGRYLCASGRMSTSGGWLAAVYAYNHSDSYVRDVADLANSYAAGAA